MSLGFKPHRQVLVACVTYRLVVMAQPEARESRKTQALLIYAARQSTQRGDISKYQIKMFTSRFVKTKCEVSRGEQQQRLSARIFTATLFFFHGQFFAWHPT